MLGQTGSGACPSEARGSPVPLFLIAEEPLVCKHVDGRVKGDSRVVEQAPQTPSGRARK